MATWRQALEVGMTDEEVARLMVVSRSRTEPASRVQRAQMLLAYRENPSFFAVAQRVGVHDQTVQRCIERALAYGPLMALSARAWLSEASASAESQGELARSASALRRCSSASNHRSCVLSTILSASVSRSRASVGSPA